MDSEAYDRISGAQRVGVVAAACAADMLVNFPLWICAKRISAGLSLPPAREIYKGSGSLYLAMGPMTIVEDGSTALALPVLGGRLEPAAAHAASACFAGGVGALAVGCQVEGVITRAHATGETVLAAARSTHAARGWGALLMPHGAAMIACREVPYAGCLFFLSGHIRSRLREAGLAGGGGGGGWRGTCTDMLGAALTACVAGPISHVPSVIASHQQAHAVSLPDACRAIHAAAGARGFWAGLLPRTGSLAGSLFVMPFAVESLQPVLERWLRDREGGARDALG